MRLVPLTQAAGVIFRRLFPLFGCLHLLFPFVAESTGHSKMVAPEKERATQRKTLDECATLPLSGEAK